MKRPKPKRRRRSWVECARAILRLAFLAGAMALLAPRGAGSQMRTFRVRADVAMIDTAFPASSSYIPDKVYDRWWHEIAECEGLPLPPFYALVRWHQINASFFADSAGAAVEEKAGANISWFAAVSYLNTWQTFVALPYRYVEEVIKHEMLHWLLRWHAAITQGHPSPYFGRCGVYEKYPHSKS